MAERDTDIEFDFFEEPEAPDETRARRTLRRGPRRPARPPPRGRPLLRLVGLIAVAILLVVVLVLWVRSCREAGEREAYEEYMNNVTLVAQSSEGIGRDFGALLTAPGVREPELRSRLVGLARRQREDVTRTQDLSPPGRLRTGHEEVVEALQLRVSGLRGLASTFRRTARTRDLDSASGLLGLQAQRLVASDVVWDDLFKDPAAAELRRQGVGGVAVPDSNFVRDPDLGSSGFWLPVLRRLRGTATTTTPGTVRGNGVVAVTVLPSGRELSTDAANTVRSTADLAFAVTVENSGSSQEVRVPVTLTIAQRPPIVREQRIDVINPRERKRLVFGDLPAVAVGTRTTVRVEVAPVPGEKTTTNNEREYPVFFSLTSP